MDLFGINDSKRNKINFRIPKKADHKFNEVKASSEFKIVSPLILHSKPRNKNFVKQELVENEPSSTVTLKETDKQILNKRKNSTRMPLYSGRNALYPEELNNLILPLFCKLCNANLNSAKSAYFHYISKSHEKKINYWLIDWSKRTGEPAPKIYKDESHISKDSSLLFCEYCSVKLTSLQDAKQHYGGKKHASKVNYSETVDSSNNVTKNYKCEICEIETTSEHQLTIHLNGSKHIKKLKDDCPEPAKNLFCDICNICTTSEQQLTIHLQGTKHLKKLKEVCPELAIAERDSHIPKDLLNFRTPSGQFYCKICNITLLDDKIFSQHIASKKHIKNFKRERKPTTYPKNALL